MLDAFTAPRVLVSRAWPSFADLLTSVNRVSLHTTRVSVSEMGVRSRKDSD